MNEYLMPANSKKSALKLGLFTNGDLIVLAIGSLLTVLLGVTVAKIGFVGTLIALSPAFLTAVLVFPVPHYHNVRQLLINIYTYYMRAKRYYWRGWCVKYEEDNR